MGEESSNNSRRARFYKLVDEQWIEIGTGNLSLDKEKEIVTLTSETASDEGEHETILACGVSKNPSHYTVQGSSIICWCDESTEEELALSFETAGGCREFVDFLNDARHPLPPLQVQTDNQAQEGDSSADQMSDIPRAELPECTMSSLADLADFLEDVRVSREAICEAILRQDYIPKLVEMFGMLEDLESTDSLHHLYRAMKAIAVLGEEEIYNVLLNDDNFESFVGTMEYDPELPPGTGKFRDFLATKSRFIQLIPLENESIVNKIHLNYRLMFMKDVLLPRSLDEGSFGSINGIVLRNSLAIANHLRSNDQYLKSLCKGASNCSDIKKQKQYLLLLDEVIQLAKGVGNLSKPSMFESLVANGFFSIFENGTLFSKVRKSRQAAIDSLHDMVNTSVELVRDYVIESTNTTVDGKEDKCLLWQLLQVVALDKEPGIQSLAADILAMLLDVDTMQDTTSKDKILTPWYDRYMSKMVDLVVQEKPDWVTGERTIETAANAKYQATEMLASFMRTHDFRIKYFVLKQNLFSKMLQACKTPQLARRKHIVLATIRVFKTCLMQKQDFYYRYIMQNRIMALIFDILEQHMERNNLVVSSILDILSFVKAEGKYDLIEEIIQKRQQTMKTLIEQGITLAEDLVERCKEGTDRNKNGEKEGQAISTLAGVARPPPASVRRDIESDDDKYLESDDEPATSGTMDTGIERLSKNERAMPSGVLVNYEDDEDDEDSFGPPPPTHKKRDDDDEGGLLIRKRRLSDRSPQKLEIVSSKKFRASEPTREVSD